MMPIRAKQRPCLSQDRIAKLEAIGFQWKVKKPPIGWERRFQQLVDYKNANGHCNVPQSFPPDRPFGRWVMKQRCEYSLKIRGEKSQLRDDRVARLNALGFLWVAPCVRKKTFVTNASGEVEEIDVEVPAETGVDDDEEEEEGEDVDDEMIDAHGHGVGPATPMAGHAPAAVPPPQPTAILLPSEEGNKEEAMTSAMPEWEV
jgi:hypothetical protein